MTTNLTPSQTAKVAAWQKLAGHRRLLVWIEESMTGYSSTVRIGYEEVGPGGWPRRRSTMLASAVIDHDDEAINRRNVGKMRDIAAVVASMEADRR